MFSLCLPGNTDLQDDKGILKLVAEEFKKRGCAAHISNPEIINVDLGNEWQINSPGKKYALQLHRSQVMQ